MAFALLALFCGSGARVAAQTAEPAAWGQWAQWGEMAGEKYANPVLPADFSDIDCIKVGKKYYAISSTFQFSPGMIILESRDLVNWRVAGHAVSDITQISPELSWRRMNRYGRGIWAGTIRHHNGRFYVIFGTPEEGYFVTSAKKIGGPWAPVRCILPESGWDDCTATWDADGQAYIAGTHFADGYRTYVWRAAQDLSSIDRESGVLVNEGSGREASKLLWHNGFCYLVYSEHQGWEGRYVMARRAKHPQGPYGEAKRLTRNLPQTNEPNQGGLVEGPDGQWYFLTHHGTGDWEGRAMSLLPVDWSGDWPVIGKADNEGLGTMVWQAPMPGKSTRWRLEQSDEFNKKRLNPALEWNYQPREDKISLAKGRLRLFATTPLERGNLLKTNNILTGRVVRTARCQVVTKVDVSHLHDGGAAGLCHFSEQYSWLGVVQKAGQRYICYNENGRLLDETPLPAATTIWLRSEWGLDGLSRYAYSTDGIHFQDFGKPYQLRWGYYRGDRYGIFCANEQGENGWADFDFLRCNVE